MSRSMNGVSGIPFGDPSHPFRYESEVMRKRGKKGRIVSPWNRGPMVETKTNRTNFERYQRKP